MLRALADRIADRIAARILARIEVVEERLNALVDVAHDSARAEVQRIAKKDAAVILAEKRWKNGRELVFTDSRGRPR